MRNSQIEEIRKQFKFLAESIVRKKQKVALVGSRLMQIDLPSSDIDFALSAESEDRELLRHHLNNLLEFRGERVAGWNTTRLLFCQKTEGHHVDLNIMTPTDFRYLVVGLHLARKELTNKEKQAIKDQKQRLKLSGKTDELEEFKCGIYRKYCPELVWEPDFVIRRKLLSCYYSKGYSIPAWLKRKEGLDVPTI